MAPRVDQPRPPGKDRVPAQEGPGTPAGMGKSLVLWFLYTIMVGIFVAYATAAIPDSIWRGQACGFTDQFNFDGVVYGLVTGARSGWTYECERLSPQVVLRSGTAVSATTLQSA